jgi:tetratricopeptide (TPR) repeat protein
LRNVLTLLILLAMAAGAIIVFGRIPLDLPVDALMSRVKKEQPGGELNAKAVEKLAAGSPLEAVEMLREAVRLEPENTVVRRNLSVALARVAGESLKDTDKAKRLLDESEQLWPVNPEALDGLANLHYREGRYEEALGYARKLQKRMPGREDLAKYVAHLEQRVSSREGMVIEEGDNFRLLYSGQRKLEYEGQILALLQVEMDSLTVALGIFPSEPVDVLILTEELGSRADPFDPFLEGLYDGQIRLYVGEGIEDEEKLALTVRHEMVHALLHRAVGNLPSWVQEGLAQKVGEEPSPEHLQEVRSYMFREISKGYVVDLASLDRSFITMDAERRTRAYAVSLLFMDYLEHNYSRNFIPLLVSELTDGTAPVKAIESLTGKSFHQLQQSFIRELRS